MTPRCCKHLNDTSPSIEEQPMGYRLSRIAASSRNGHHLMDVSHNVPESTLLNQRGEATHILGGILVLSFASSHLSQDTQWTIHDHLASDYFATCITFNISKLHSPHILPRWNGKKADWQAFRHHLDSLLEAANASPDIDGMENRLVDAFHAAADKAIPLTKHPSSNYKDRSL
ncbi:hypothetical protein GWK47_024888 [Chionoecetes opilio]|uniref:Uncharacterized protein n=1 Tax=Chionoecetes opilio TaxID=41210 RepID=A0A8J4XLH5_CHIOP|nr:hypothetical protein GWK47_024888 [Chionoecetes opilio]